MMLRRVAAGMAVVFGLSVWSWFRADDNAVHASPAGPVTTATATTDAGGNHDDAAARYRGNQSRHWRQVMIGGR